MAGEQGTKGAAFWFLNVLNDTVVINQTNQTVLNAIKYYCRSVFDALNEGDLSLMQFYSI